MKINVKIKQLLTERRLTMSELASFCGVSPQAVKQWVDANGTSPRGKRLKKIAEFFKMSEVELVYGEELPDPSDQSQFMVRDNRATYNEKEISKPSTLDEKFTDTTAPYYREIEEVIRLMENTDDRGRLKVLLAVEDTLAVHASVTLRASAAAFDQPIDETLLKIIRSYNQATPSGKMLIVNATVGASKEEEHAPRQNAG